MGIIRVPFYAVCMLLTAPGKFIFFLSQKLRKERDLENTENVCGLIIGLAVHNLLRNQIANFWARVGLAVLIAVVVVVIFHLAVRDAQSAREAIQYYMRPFARYYDHCLAEIKRRLGIGKKKNEKVSEESHRTEEKKAQKSDRTGEQGAKERHQSGEDGARASHRTGEEKKTRANGRTGSHDDRQRNGQSAGREYSRQQAAGQGPRRRRRMTPFEEAKSLFNVELPYSLEEIRDKRNLLLKTYHPDNQNGSEEMCKKINECYDLLAKYI